MKIRKLFLLVSSLLVLLILSGCGSDEGKSSAASSTANAQKAEAAEGVSVADTGELPIVYYTKDISPAGMERLYAKVSQNIGGRTVIKFHRHDRYTENAADVALMKALQQSVPNSVLAEATYGGGQREAEEMLRRFRSQGLDFCEIDVVNVDGGVEWPIEGGRLLKSALVAKNLANYDSLIVYAPFRGTAYPGYGAALTNVGVGLQDDKGRIHGSPLNKDPEFFERMAEAGKAITDHFAGHTAYITLLEEVELDCDCHSSERRTYGIIASNDIVAVDRAALDIVFADEKHQTHSLTEKKGTLLGLYQLEYMENLGMGSTQYTLVEID